MTPGNSDAHALVYQALDQVLADKVILPGTPRAMFAAIDTLRSSSAPIEQVRRAENIAVQMHRFQSALQQSDERQIALAFGGLKSMAAEWLEMRIHSRH